MGAQSTYEPLTDARGGAAPADTLLFVGVDVGRRHHVVAAISLERMEAGTWLRTPVRRWPTSGAGFRELTGWLESFQLPPEKVAIGCEPTGGWYARTIAGWLERSGYRVDWLQNWALHERRELLIGKQTKTDALDARLIARLLFEREHLGHPAGFLQRPPRSADGIRMLIRNRTRLVEQRIRYRLQLTTVEDVLFPELRDFFTSSVSGATARLLLEAFPTPKEVAAAKPSELRRVLISQARAYAFSKRIDELQGLASNTAGLVAGIDAILVTQRWLLSQLRHVDVQIAELEGQVRAGLKAWSAAEMSVLDSFPAMSAMRAAVVLSTIGDIGTFRTDRQIRKLFGWYPESRESGSSVANYRLGNRGNRIARREIWLWGAQLVSRQHPPSPFRVYYQRLRGRGVPGYTAMGHLAGKLLSLVFFCLRSGEPYDPLRHAQALHIDEAFLAVGVSAANKDETGSIRPLSRNDDGAG
jgi:transposase